MKSKERTASFSMNGTTKDQHERWKKRAGFDRRSTRYRFSGLISCCGVVWTQTHCVTTHCGTCAPQWGKGRKSGHCHESKLSKGCEELDSCETSTPPWEENGLSYDIWFLQSHIGQNSCRRGPAESTGWLRALTYRNRNRNLCLLICHGFGIVLGCYFVNLILVGNSNMRYMWSAVTAVSIILLLNLIIR